MFSITIIVKWLYYGVVMLTMSIMLSRSHMNQKYLICRLHAEVIVLQVILG